MRGKKGANLRPAARIGAVVILPLLAANHCPTDMPPPPAVACKISGSMCQTNNCQSPGGCVTEGKPPFIACRCDNPIRNVQIQARFVTNDLSALSTLPARTTFFPVGDWPIEGTFDGLSFAATVTPVGSMTVEFELDTHRGEPVYRATVTHLGVRALASRGVETNLVLPRPISIGLARLLPVDAPWIAITDTSTAPPQPIFMASILTIRPDSGSTDGFLGVLASSPIEGVTLQGEVSGTLDFADGSWALTFSASPCPNGRVICDIDGDGEVRRNDIEAILAARGTPAIPGDSRDADGDGLITVNDARICVLACTKPECAP
jgi:hypothetical protein